jgi:hypothetical protein
MQLVPDVLPIGAPPFVAVRFILQDPVVHELVLRAIGADHPDPVHQLPDPFVGVDQQGRIRRRELHVIDPIGAVPQASDRPGVQIQGVELHRKPPGQALFHHLGLVRRLESILAACLAFALRARRGAGAAIFRFVALGVDSGGQRLVGIDGEDLAAPGQGADFPALSRVDLGGIELRDLSAPLRVINGRRLPADDHGPGGPGTTCRASPVARFSTEIPAGVV